MSDACRNCTYISRELNISSLWINNYNVKKQTKILNNKFWIKCKKFLTSLRLVKNLTSNWDALPNWSRLIQGFSFYTSCMCGLDIYLWSLERTWPTIKSSLNIITIPCNISYVDSFLFHIQISLDNTKVYKSAF